MARSFYPYEPSTPTAIVFAALYTVSFIATFIQWIRYRAWVWVIMVFASAMEALGYVGRAISVQKTDQRTLFIIQYCFIILAPVVIAAALYVCFARIVYHVVPAQARRISLLWVPPRFLTLIFVVCDIAALFVQLIGALIVSSTQVTDSDAAAKLDRGKTIVLIGLGVQLACFGFFAIVATRFHFVSRRFRDDFQRRIGTAPGEKHYIVDNKSRKYDVRWPLLLAFVNVSSVLILVRSIYRVCEFSLGKTGYITSNEWCMYVFDAAPMLPCIALFIYWHPAKYLPHLGFRLPKNVRNNNPQFSESAIELTH